MFSDCRFQGAQWLTGGCPDWRSDRSKLSQK